MAMPRPYALPSFPCVCVVGAAEITTASMSSFVGNAAQDYSDSMVDADGGGDDEWVGVERGTSDEWLCGLCAMMNSKDAANCVVCHSERGGPGFAAAGAGAMSLTALARAASAAGDTRAQRSTTASTVEQLQFDTGVVVCDAFSAAKLSTEGDAVPTAHLVDGPVVGRRALRLANGTALTLTRTAAPQDSFRVDVVVRMGALSARPLLYLAGNTPTTVLLASNGAVQVRIEAAGEDVPVTLVGSAVIAPGSWHKVTVAISTASGQLSWFIDDAPVGSAIAVELAVMEVSTIVVAPTTSGAGPVDVASVSVRGTAAAVNASVISLLDHGL